MEQIFVEAGSVHLEGEAVGEAGDIPPPQIRLKAKRANWQRLPQGFGVYLVVRLEGPDAGQALLTNWQAVSSSLLQAIKECTDEARLAEVFPRGFVVDATGLDAPSGSLARALKRISKELRAGSRLAVLIRTEHLSMDELNAVAKSVDFTIIRARNAEASGPAWSALESYPSPVQISELSLKAHNTGGQYMFLLDFQPVYYPLTESGELAGTQMRSWDHRNSPLRFSNIPEPPPGNKPPLGVDYVIMAFGRENQGRRALVVAPGPGGLARYLNALPVPGMRGYAGPVLAAAKDSPDRLALGDSALLQALQDEPCTPQPQISLEPVNGNRNRIIISIDNTANCRVALAQKSVRLRILASPGVITGAGLGQFAGRQAYQTTDDNGVTQLALEFYASMMETRIRTGPIDLAPGENQSMSITAFLESPGGGQPSASTLKINLQ